MKLRNHQVSAGRSLAIVTRSKSSSLTIIARREKSAKGAAAACVQSDKLANITRPLPHRFVSLSSSSGKAKSGEDQWLKFQLHKSVLRAVASESIWKTARYRSRY